MSAALIVSANGISEETGGGIYLRGVTDGISQEFTSTILVCKDSDRPYDDKYKNIRIFLLRRTFFSELISRFFFQASFLAYYVPYIVLAISKLKERVDVIYIHGTKHGLLLILLKKVFRAKIVVLTDNIEVSLYENMIANARSWMVKTKLFIELFFVRISEKISIKNSDVVSFITQHDLECAVLMYSIDCPSIIWPVTLFDDEHSPKKKIKDYAIFTGSFKFQPNIDAFEELKRLLSKHSVNLKIAGLAASKLMLSDEERRHFEIICSPTREVMRALFRSAYLFISPVRFGSGMKTKVAEALMFGLPVIGTRHSFIGYEEIVDSGVVFVIDDENSMLKFIENINSCDIDALSTKAYEIYKNFYSEKRSRQCAKESINKLMKFL